MAINLSFINNLDDCKENRDKSRWGKGASKRGKIGSISGRALHDFRLVGAVLKRGKFFMKGFILARWKSRFVGNLRASGTGFWRGEMMSLEKKSDEETIEGQPDK